MRHARVFALAGAAALYAPAALAADLTPVLPPQPVCVPRSSVPPGYPSRYPICPEEVGGWYLRGDIGMSNQELGSMHQRLYDTPGTVVRPVGTGFDSAPFFGVGLGYQWNNWLRFDVTGEYRGRANFHRSDNVTFTGGIGVDNYSGSKSEWLFMANAYVDLGTWWSITPFVGAGIGMAYNRIQSFRDDGCVLGLGCNSVTYADDASKWNVAWAIHAGLAYKVNRNFTIELAYRYLDLGDATTGPTNSFDGVTVVNGGAFEFHKITSHDVKLGLRWTFDPGFGFDFHPASYAPPPAPIYTEPRPGYVQPPSIYTPPQPAYPPYGEPAYPPLRSRG